jgi:hypothetical protein
MMIAGNMRGDLLCQKHQIISQAKPSLSPARRVASAVLLL